MSYRVTISEEALQKARAELAPVFRLLDIIPKHIVIDNLDGNIFYASPATEKITGWSPAELLGKNPGDCYGGLMEQEYYKNLWSRIKNDKKKFIGTLKNRRKDGTQYLLELYILPILDDSGNAKYFLGFEPAFGDESELTAKQLDALGKLLRLFERENIELTELIKLDQ